MITASHEAPSRASFILASQGDNIKISTIGSRAWLIEAPGDFDLPAQRRIWSLAVALRARDDIESLIPGVTNLLVLFRQTPADYDATFALLVAAWEQAQAVHPQGKLIEIPVIYGGEHATDLDAV